MIVTLVGARPQFVKAAVVSKALNDLGVEETIVHSGQHYDVKMSDVFWSELGIPKALFNLACGSGTQGKQTAAIIEGFEKFLLELPEKPKAILVYGDTNSTLAGAIVASKLHIPIIHVEAGLRSFNREMPEEINRVVTDHLSGLLFCPSSLAVAQLAKEGITDHVYDVGDVMFDALQTFSSKYTDDALLRKLGVVRDKFLLLTLHRPSNTDDPHAVAAILASLQKNGMDVLWPLHPRLKASINAIEIPGNVHVCEPLSYLEMLGVLSACCKVITDSGGLQKEAYWSKKPCVTLRKETEWTETVHNNWNILAGADSDKIYRGINTTVDAKSWKALYGDGTASKQIAKHIKQYLTL